MTAPPSLRGLQAFEAAARTGSFAAAARELSVSPAAISQLVRGLEDHVGRQLFRRVNRGIALSEAGLEILPRLSAAFDEIRGVSHELAGASPRARLTVSVPPSAATGWLSARLASFLKLHGPMDISLRGEEDPVEFDRDLIDIRMSYGPFHYVSHETHDIMIDEAVPVCAPELVSRHGPFETVASLKGAPLIHTDWGPGSAKFPSWRDFFEAGDVPVDRAAERGTVANSSHAAIDLAVSGLGVALGQGMFVSRHIDEGRLVRPVDHSVALGQPYCLTIRQRSASRPAVECFRDWIIEECKRSLLQATVKAGKTQSR